MKKRILSVLLTLAMLIGMMPMAAFAATDAEGNHVCDNPGGYCLVHNVAELINELPAADEITVNNAAKVIEQIHAIDRIKVDLVIDGDTDQYAELLTLVETTPNEQGEGYDNPKAYVEAVKAIRELTGGGSLSVEKKFTADGTDVNVSEAMVKFEIRNVETNAVQTLTMSTMPYAQNSLSADADFYTENSNGWTYKYILPAGTYTIKEVKYSGATVDGTDFITGSTSCSVNGGQTVVDTAVTFAVEDGKEISVMYINSYDNGHVHPICSDTPGCECGEGHDDIIWTEYDGTSTTLTEGAYYLTADVELTSTLTIRGDVSLCLNGHKIQYVGTEYASVITVESGTLDLTDCNGDNGSFDFVYENDPEEGETNRLYVWNLAAEGDTPDQTVSGGVITGGKFTRDNSSYYYGGGVYVAENSIFNMYGGTIVGNNISGGWFDCPHGGGVYVAGEFTLYDGAIKGNTVISDSSYAYGGGVCVAAGGSFVMNGGTIAENASNHNGGGIVLGSDKIGGGSFVMNGGKISGNYATYAAAIWAQNDYSDISIEINDGEITGNYGQQSASSAVSLYGFGEYDASFIMNGGSITENYSGGLELYDITGAIINGGTFTGHDENHVGLLYGSDRPDVELAGTSTLILGSEAPIVMDEIYFGQSDAENKEILIEGGLHEDSDIFFTGIDPAAGSPITFTTGGSAGDFINCFSTNTNKYIDTDDENELVVGLITYKINVEATGGYDISGFKLYDDGWNEITNYDTVGVPAGDYFVYFAPNELITSVEMKCADETVEAPDISSWAGSYGIYNERFTMPESDITIKITIQGYEDHKHPICGNAENCGDHDLDGNDDECESHLYTKLTDVLEFDPATGYYSINYLRTGHYYLNKDIVLSGEIKTSGDVHLCLNGKTISIANNADRIFSVLDTLTLCDCSENKTGTITGGGNVTRGSAIYIYDNYTLNMYGGNITGNTSTVDGPAIAGWDGTTINIYGGKIFDNYCEGSQEGLCLWGVTNVSFNIYGGEFDESTTSGSLICSGAVTIKGGTFNAPNGYLNAWNAVKISGSPVINTTIDVDKEEGLLTVDGELIVKEPIPVKFSENVGNFAVPGGDPTSLEDCVDCFTSKQYKVVSNVEGGLDLVYYNATVDVTLDVADNPLAEVTLKTDKDSSTDEFDAAAGDTVSVEVTPNIGYFVADIEIYNEENELVEFKNGQFTMPASDVTVYVTVEPTVVKVKVTDAVTEESIDEVQIMFIDSQSGVVWEDTLDEDVNELTGIFDADNEYTVIVKSVPAGYTFVTDSAFELDAEGVVSSDDIDITTDGVLNIKLSKTKVGFAAYNAGGDYLDDATIKIEGDELGEAITVELDAEPLFLEGVLPIGSYTVTVITPPEGFVIPAPIEFEIGDYGELNIETVDNIVAINFIGAAFDIQIVDSDGETVEVDYYLDDSDVASSDLAIDNIATGEHTITIKADDLALVDGINSTSDVTVDFTIDNEGNFEIDDGDPAEVIVNAATGKVTIKITLERKTKLTFVPASDITGTYGDAVSDIDLAEGFKIFYTGTDEEFTEYIFDDLLVFTTDYEQGNIPGGYTIFVSLTQSEEVTALLKAYDITFEVGALTITSKTLTIEDLDIIVDDKYWDGTTDVVVTVTVLEGSLVNEDDEVTLNASAAFGDAKVGEDKEVALTIYAELEGAQAEYYVLADDITTTTTADIMPLPDKEGDGIYEHPDNDGGDEDRFFVPDGDNGYNEVVDNGDGTYTDEENDIDYIPDQNNDNVAEQEKDDVPGIFEDEEANDYVVTDNGIVDVVDNEDGTYTDEDTDTDYIPDQDDDNKAEPETDVPGIFEGTTDEKDYIVNEDGEAKEVEGNEDGVYDEVDGDNYYIPDQDDDNKAEPETDVPGIFEGTTDEKDYVIDPAKNDPYVEVEKGDMPIYEEVTNGTEGDKYIPDQNGDHVAEKMTKPGIFEDDEGGDYIVDEDGEIKEVVDNGDGTYTDPDAEPDTDYIPDQDGDGLAEPDTDGDGIFEGTEDSNDDGEEDRYINDKEDGVVKDDDNDGIFEDEEDNEYVPVDPDRDGKVDDAVRVEDEDGDGIYEDEDGNLYDPDYDADGDGNPDIPVPFVATPVITPNGGKIDIVQQVTMTTTTKGAVIYYTTDGTVPSATNGKKYAGYINVKDTTVVRAIAVKEGSTDSGIAEAIFTKSGIVLPTVNDIIINPTVNGTVTADRTKSTIAATVTVTVKADSGYKLNTFIVMDSKGHAVSLTDNGNGVYTFRMPMRDVYVTATFVKIDDTPEAPEVHVCPSEVFLDLDTDMWYHEAIDFVLANGYMNGMGNATFRPNSPLNRAMIVQVLYNMEGKPTHNGTATFKDVTADDWYYDAINWAAETKIVEGYSDIKFGPTDNITREQMATIMWRYAMYKGYDVSVGENTSLQNYGDSSAVSEYAIYAMKWACGAGLVQGIAEGNAMNLKPQGNATRAQIATILYRFCENVID